MSDKELREYLMIESQKHIFTCCKCGKGTFDKNDRVALGKYIGGVYYKLCNLCNDCYCSLLEFLEISDI